MLWRTNAKAVLDISCCVDTLAVACLEQGIMYAGICFTPSGVDFLKKRLAAVVSQKFLDESSPIYKPTLAKTVNRIHGHDDESVVPKKAPRGGCRR